MDMIHNLDRIAIKHLWWRRYVYVYVSFWVLFILVYFLGNSLNFLRMKNAEGECIQSIHIRMMFHLLQKYQIIFGLQNFQFFSSNFLSKSSWKEKSHDLPWIGLQISCEFSIVLLLKMRNHKFYGLLYNCSPVQETGYVTWEWPSSSSYTDNIHLTTTNNQIDKS